MNDLIDFYKNKKILITGHTGFKGAWLTKILTFAGAEVIGYALNPPTNPSLFEIADLGKDIRSVTGDICDYELLKKTFEETRPEIVFHLAAQPIVIEGYKHPRYTYETNVMGTVNILECLRNCGCTRSFLNVTTDKVYENNDASDYAFSEKDPLDGYDPYSNSKSCSELVTHSYKKSYLDEMGCAVSTARAGNVIGGGDFAPDRIIPDCVRAAINKEVIKVRNPHSIRPYQHVLEPLFAYLLIASEQYKNTNCADYYNVGPDNCDCYETGRIVELFVKGWGEGLKWIDESKNGPHEAKYLKLDCTKIKRVLSWTPRWNLPVAVEKTVEWTKCLVNGGDVNDCMENQIEQFLNSGVKK